MARPGTVAAVVAAVMMFAAANKGHGHHHHGGLASLLSSAHVSVASSTSANEAMANRLAARRYGWDTTQQDCLDTLWNHESGFSATADTRASGLDPADATVYAYGIPQARPASKLPLAGRPPEMGGHSSARAQELWGLKYIYVTYGSPCAALASDQASGMQGY